MVRKGKRREDFFVLREDKKGEEREGKIFFVLRENKKREEWVRYVKPYSSLDLIVSIDLLSM